MRYLLLALTALMMLCFVTNATAVRDDQQKDTVPDIKAIVDTAVQL